MPCYPCVHSAVVTLSKGNIEVTWHATSINKLRRSISDLFRQSHNLDDDALSLVVFLYKPPSHVQYISAFVSISVALCFWRYSCSKNDIIFKNTVICKLKVWAMYPLNEKSNFSSFVLAELSTALWICLSFRVFLPLKNFIHSCRTLKYQNWFIAQLQEPSPYEVCFEKCYKSIDRWTCIMKTF